MMLLYHLIVANVVRDKWYLYMTNSMLNHINQNEMKVLFIYPHMQEWKVVIDELNELQQLIASYVQFNPTILTANNIPKHMNKMKQEFYSLTGQGRDTDPPIHLLTSMASETNESTERQRWLYGNI